ncbi:GNAT family N-acetyltransferase [Methanoculleus sp. UBA303]|jgi:GNAT superfamily N-acetyltransferase|uniref:GNAT family N-acetyltransferase n=1 Tax=Methanoculleus sp. UBA303 TaxID=1915497 RepID=UPI002A717F95|nr:hypothetical protein [Candidatus Methanomethylophilaceae archaeon]
MPEQGSFNGDKPQKIPWDELKVQSICGDIDPSSFFCQDEKLNEFLYRRAYLGHRYCVSVTHLVIYNDALVGFFSLANGMINKGKVQEFHRKIGFQHDYPVLKIVRLATHKDYENRGIGTFMIYQAIGTAETISAMSGCKFVAVDAKVKSAQWYLSRGFKGADPPEKWSTNPESTVPLYLDYKGVFEKTSPTGAHIDPSTN